MNYIELIGPPAVGKTTLLDLLVSKREKNQEWKSYEEAVFDIVNSLQWNQLKNTKSRALYLADKINFTKYKKLGICNTLIKELTSEIPRSIQKKYEYLLDSQFKALASLDRNISAINKCALLNWHQQSLHKLFLLEALEYHKTVVFDEGPLKTHFGLSKTDLNLIDKSTLPTAVIYCFSNFEENLERVKKRIAQTGQLNKIHNRLNNKGMEYLVNYTQKIAEKNIVFIEHIGVPIFKIDLTYPLKQLDLTELYRFLQTHSTMISSAGTTLLESKSTSLNHSNL